MLNRKSRGEVIDHEFEIIVINLGRAASRFAGWGGFVLARRVDPKREGELIAEINRSAVRNVGDAIEAVNLFKGLKILLRVYSTAGGRGSTHYLSVETGKK